MRRLAGKGDVPRALPAIRTSRQPPQRDGGLPGLPGHTADLDAKIDDSFDRLTPLGERELGDASLSLR